MVWLSLHAIPGGLTLLLGPVNFVTAVRQRYPVAHRMIGRIYLLCVLIGSIMGVISAVMSTSGLVAQLGFLLLAIAWFYSGLMAYRTIRRREIQLHRVWMIRNYALSFSAVLLRIFLAAGIAYLPLNPAISFESVYTSSVWCSIAISYVVAEWFIVQRVLRPLAVNAGAPPQPLA